MKRALIVAALAALAAPAQANFTFFMNGNDLLAQCQSGNSHERSLCLGYIEGVVVPATKSRSTKWSGSRFEACSIARTGSAVCGDSSPSVGASLQSVQRRKLTSARRCLDFHTDEGRHFGKHRSGLSGALGPGCH